MMLSFPKTLLISLSNAFNMNHLFSLSQPHLLEKIILRSALLLSPPPLIFPLLQSLVIAHNLSMTFSDYANDPSNAERIQKSLSKRLNSHSLLSSFPPNSHTNLPLHRHFFSAVNLNELKSRGFSLLHYLLDPTAFLVHSLLIQTFLTSLFFSRTRSLWLQRSVSTASCTLLPLLLLVLLLMLDLLLFLQLLLLLSLLLRFVP
jgi:hypothetical protein